MSLKLISINVNGMRDNKKRSVIFNWLKEKNFDICLVQESHCATQDDVNTWSKEWKGKSYWSPGTKMSRGVACLIKHNLDITIVHTDKDPNGRYLCVDLNIDDIKISIANIYAPNSPQERKSFFKKLNEKLDLKQQGNEDRDLILTGDFNCTLNPVFDRRNNKGDNVHINDTGNTELINLMTDQSIEDVWRRRNPKQRRYTYFKKNSKTASRIDFWLVSKTLSSYILNANIINAPLSDHSAITIN